jgi:hypothetical protein
MATGALRKRTPDIPARRRGRHLLRIARRCLLAAFMAGIATSGQAQDGTGPAPDNAQDRRYGSGWDCNPGYRIAEGVCVALEMPANSYPTGRSHGTGWACQHGYREVSTCPITPISTGPATAGNATGDFNFRRRADVS